MEREPTLRVVPVSDLQALRKRGRATPSRRESSSAQRRERQQQELQHERTRIVGMFVGTSREQRGYGTVRHSSPQERLNGFLMGLAAENRDEPRFEGTGDYPT